MSDIKTTAVLMSGWKFVPTLRHQNREESQLRWAGCSRAKCSRWGVSSDQCLEVDGCRERKRKPVEVTEDGAHMGILCKIYVWLENLVCRREPKPNLQFAHEKLFYNPDLIWLLSPVWSILNGWKLFKFIMHHLNAWTCSDATEIKFFYLWIWWVLYS